MGNRKPRLTWKFLSVFIMTFLFVSSALPQVDPDPNSPIPVLISEDDSIRALTSADSSLRKTSRQTSAKAFRLNEKVNLFVTNVDLMAGEGANAFRIYAEDKAGRKYRFPVLELEPLSGQEWIYKITVLLKDEIGYWEPPAENGDIQLRLTWRGHTSNAVKLGLGRTDDTLRKDAGDTLPTPLKSFAVKPDYKEPPTSELVGYRFSGDRIRFLEQATFGPTVELDQRIRRIGLRTWLAEQFQAQYPGVENPYPDLALKSSDSSNATTGCGPSDGSETRRICIRDHYSMYRLQKWFFNEAFYGDAQLKHRVAWALSQIWVTSGVDIQQASHMIAYHKILSNNAFGNYRDLMEEMTLNPAMGEYLDMARSTKNSPNENYAREILQLFSIGLFMLNQDGTLQMNANQPIPTYDQETVNNFTKVFTGWSFCNNGSNPACPSAISGTVNFKDPMLLNQNNHNVTAKTLLNYPNAVNPTLPANQNGALDMEQALDNIFHHPNVAPFVSRLLIQHLVTSDPTPAYVGRVAAKFNNNGFGTRGDLKEVVRAILLDPEARGDVKTDPNYGKLREPVLLATNILKQFNVRSADGAAPSDGVVASIPNSMAQNPFFAPTVFNYYSPDYMVPGTALNGPEFGIMTTGTSIARANAGNTLVYSRINTGQDAPNGTSIDLSEMTQLAQADPTGNQVVNALNTKLLHGTMSTPMRNTILTAFLAQAANNPQSRAQAAIYLVVTSSQFQVQR